MISIENGKILDTETICKLCKACNAKEKLKEDDLAAYNLWKSYHECSVNYTGSAPNMEPVAAKRIFERSVEKYGLRYMDYNGDGDSRVLAYNSYCFKSRIVAIKRFSIFVRRSGTSLASKCKYVDMSVGHIISICHSYTLNKCKCNCFRAKRRGEGCFFIHKNSLRKNNGYERDERGRF